MPIPTYDEFIEPLLRFLAKHPDGVRSGAVYAALADQVGLTDEEREQRLPSRRQPVHHNRIGWAHDRLKRAGLSTSARRGVWTITPKGIELLRSHPQAFTAEEVEALAKVPDDSRLRRGARQPIRPAYGMEDLTVAGSVRVACGRSGAARSIRRGRDRPPAHDFYFRHAPATSIAPRHKHECTPRAAS